MRLDALLYCDGPDCDIRTHLGADRFDGAGALVSLPPGFLWLRDGSHSRAFCGYDCLMKWAAQFPPPERVEAEG